MRRHDRTRSGARLAFLLALVLAALASGCDVTPFETNDDFDPSTLPNQRPLARIFVTDEDSIAATSYNNARFHWSGTDVDGFVKGFHVAIGAGAMPPVQWAFTTSDETTATYATDALGQASPRLYVVAKDDRGALSDTVSTAFPLVNFPPTLEFARDFKPLVQSFGAASFDFFGFDRDGDDTLMPWADYRFEGADPDVVRDEDDPLADPTTGWVRVARNPTRFSLALRNIPAGNPGADFEQTLYVRLTDEGSATVEFEHVWQNFEVRGEVLLVDDNLTQPSRDRFYEDALAAHLGDQFSTWDISAGLPDRDEDLRLTFSQFRVIVWYTGSGASANLRRSEGLLREFVAGDIDPDTPGVQVGKLWIENQALVGTASNLSSTFRSQVLHIANQTDPRNPLATYNSVTQSALGPLDILAQEAGLSDLVSIGEDYDGGPGRYFGLVGLTPLATAAPLYRFESYTWGGPTDLSCRLGCEPVVAVRQPATGEAQVISLGFQIEWANASGNAIDAIVTLLRDHLGVPGVSP